MKRWTRLLALAALAAAPLSAQSYSIAPKTHVGDGGSNFHRPFDQYDCRFQQIFDADVFSTGKNAFLCKGLAFRKSKHYLGRQGGTNVELELRMALAAPGVDSSSLNAVFDKNIDQATQKVCFSRKRISVPLQTKFEFGFQIKFDSGRDFSVVPSSGRSIVVEYRVIGDPSGIGYGLDAALPIPTRRLGTSMAYADAYRDYLDGGSSRRLPGQLECHDRFYVSQGFDFQVGNVGADILAYEVAPLAPVFVAIGTRRKDVRIPGSACVLVVDPIWFSNVQLASTRKQASFPLAIPQDARLGNLGVLCQGISLRPHLNAAGLNTSIAYEFRIGTGKNSTIDQLPRAQWLELQRGIVTKFLH